MVEQAPPLRNQDSPRNATCSFIVLAREGAWDEAALLLQWPPSMTDPEATPEKVARALKLLLDERVWLDFEAIPGNEANEEGAPVSLGTIMEGEDELGIDLVRGVDGDWSVSATTVAGVPAMAKSMGIWWITSLPEGFVDVSVVEIELWQRLGLLLIAATVMVLGWVALLALHHSARLVDRGGLGVLRESISVLAVAIVYLLGLSIALQALGMDLGAVIAGLGIGTAAIALASQQTLANLFGGASVIADRVLHPGDTCAINGTIAAVERINLDVMNIVQSNGTGFAFPSQTVHLARDRGGGRVYCEIIEAASCGIVCVA